jgi:hypothetical protein
MKLEKQIELLNKSVCNFYREPGSTKVRRHMRGILFRLDEIKIECERIIYEDLKFMLNRRK